MRNIQLQMRSGYRQSHGLVIGINRYQNASPLGYAVNDARAVYAKLTRDFGFPIENLTLLLDEQATAQAIRRQFLQFCDQERIEIDDRIFVFFAGHGTTRTGHRGEVGYLVPHDANLGDLSSLLRWDELTRNAEIIPAKHILFIMDACYGGLAVTRSVGSGSTRFLRDMLGRFSRQVLTAGKADEVVADSGGPLPGHSVFTGHFLCGLDGAAATHDGIITASGVMAYVYRRVSADTDSFQTPHFGHIDGDGDFIFQMPVPTQNTNADDINSLSVVPYLDELETRSELRPKRAEHNPLSLIRDMPIADENLETLVNEFLGSDPLLGSDALEVLLNLGDKGQSALFSSGIGEPATFQVWRRLLRYVNERHETVVPVLLERLAEPNMYRDTNICSRFFGGAPRTRMHQNALYSLLSSGFESTPHGYLPNYEFFDRHGRYDDLLTAFGYAGGSASLLWSIASNSGFYWEKIRGGAFRGACAAFARGDLDAATAVERFVTTIYDSDKYAPGTRGIEVIGPAGEGFNANRAIPDEELWYETTYGAFSWWNRGDVADRILADWSRHAHWRIRRFGAMVLRRFRFRRLKDPLESWRDGELDEETRRELQNAIDDIDLDMMHETGAVAIGAGDWSRLHSPNEGETIVTMARLGDAHPRLDAMRSSKDWYDRAIAALAFGYLRRNDAVQQTDRLLKEASNPFETLMSATAVVLLGRVDLPHGLHEILVDAGSGRHSALSRRVDVRYIHRFLQIAISDALAICCASHQKAAWEREFNPLSADV